MKNLQVYFDNIENVIRRKGVDPAVCRGEKPGQWNLKRGSANVWIDVWKVKDQDYGYMQIMAPVVAVPQIKREEFFEEILETNHKLYGVGMTKFKEWIYLKAIRELDGLDESEVESTLNRIGVYADDYDDYFKEKYHGETGRAPESM